MKLFNREKAIQNHKKIIERARDLQNNLEAKRNRIGKGKYGRVLKMARKPTNDEYTKTSKITGLGMILIGGLGFLIFLIIEQGVPLIANFLGFK